MANERELPDRITEAGGIRREAHHQGHAFHGGTRSGHACGRGYS